eukprot:TRINITY_DN23726_c0_g1_i2.p2 TRINITY_DN23726_c0_g1~~TRINITY_DN23726_c0_g1_i2.p2  ORF type:complete len:964 (+),score=331.88 TRINITY_DN23726_c0_g1_i2:3624-6515(+)
MNLDLIHDLFPVNRSDSTITQMNVRDLLAAYNHDTPSRRRLAASALLLAPANQRNSIITGLLLVLLINPDAFDIFKWVEIVRLPALNVPAYVKVGKALEQYMRVSRRWIDDTPLNMEQLAHRMALATFCGRMDNRVDPLSEVLVRSTHLHSEPKLAAPSHTQFRYTRNSALRRVMNDVYETIYSAVRPGLRRFTMTLEEYYSIIIDLISNGSALGYKKTINIGGRPVTVRLSKRQLFEDDPKMLDRIKERLAGTPLWHSTLVDKFELVKRRALYPSAPEDYFLTAFLIDGLNSQINNNPEFATGSKKLAAFSGLIEQLESARDHLIACIDFTGFNEDHDLLILSAIFLFAARFKAFYAHSDEAFTAYNQVGDWLAEAVLNSAWYDPVHHNYWACVVGMFSGIVTTTDNNNLINHAWSTMAREDLSRWFGINTAFKRRFAGDDSWNALSGELEWVLLCGLISSYGPRIEASKQLGLLQAGEFLRAYYTADFMVGQLTRLMGALMLKAPSGRAAVCPLERLAALESQQLHLLRRHGRLEGVHVLFKVLKAKWMAWFISVPTDKESVGSELRKLDVPLGWYSEVRGSHTVYILRWPDWYAKIGRCSGGFFNHNGLDDYLVTDAYIERPPVPHVRAKHLADQMGHAASTEWVKRHIDNDMFVRRSDEDLATLASHVHRVQAEAGIPDQIRSVVRRDHFLDLARFTHRLFTFNPTITVTDSVYAPRVTLDYETDAPLPRNRIQDLIPFTCDCRFDAHTLESPVHFSLSHLHTANYHHLLAISRHHHSPIYISDFSSVPQLYWLNHLKPCFVLDPQPLITENYDLRKRNRLVRWLKAYSVYLPFPSYNTYSAYASAVTYSIPKLSTKLQQWANLAINDLINTVHIATKVGLTNSDRFYTDYGCITRSLRECPKYTQLGSIEHVSAIARARSTTVLTVLNEELISSNRVRWWNIPKGYSCHLAATRPASG